MRSFVSLLMVASTLGAPVAGYVSNLEETAHLDVARDIRTAGIKSSKVDADVVQVHGRSLNEVPSTALVGMRSAGLKVDHVGRGANSQSHDSLPGEAPITPPKPQRGAVEFERHSRSAQARRHPLTMLRTTRIATAVGHAGKEPEGAPSKQTAWPALGTLANSSLATAGADAINAADRWRLIAAGRLPADLPKNAAVPAAPVKQAQASTSPVIASNERNINRSEPLTDRHQMQELSGNPFQKTPKNLWSYHAEAHDRRDDPKKTEDGKNGTFGHYTSGGHDKYQEPREFLGLPKIFWALVADLIAMACFVACIPFILTIAKRRRPISSS